MTALTRSALRALTPRAPIPRTLFLPTPARLRFSPWARDLRARRTQITRLRVVLELQARERILATAREAAGELSLVLSDRALYYRDGTPHKGGYREDGGEWLRLGWERVTRAGWDPAGRLVFDAALAGNELAGAGHSRVSVPVHRRGSVPEVALERIGHTRLGTRRIALPGGGLVRVEARRRPVTDELLWILAPESGAEQRLDDDLREQATGILAHLNAEFGIPCPPASPAPGLSVPPPRLPEASVFVPRPRVACFQGSAQALVGLGGRHPDVDDRDVGP